jgi:hypothetical protein
VHLSADAKDVYLSMCVGLTLPFDDRCCSEIYIFPKILKVGQAETSVL